MFQFIYALIVLLFWGSDIILGKKALEKLNPFNALSLRYLFVFPLVIVSALIFTEIKFPSIELLPYLLFTCFIGSAAIIMFFKALAEAGASISTAIAKNYFLVTVAVSIIFLNETLSPIQFIAAFLIVCSIFLLSFERKEEKFVLGKGVVFALLTLLGWGAYFALIKPIVLELNPFNASLFLESIIFFMILAYSIATKKEFKLHERKSNMFLVGSAIVMVVGAISYNFSIALIGASLTAIIVAPTPAVTSVLARIFLKERLSKTKYLAIIISVIGLVLLFI